MRIKQPCYRKVRDFAMGLRARKVSGAFEKRPPGPNFFVIEKDYPTSPRNLTKSVKSSTFLIL